MRWVLLAVICITLAFLPWRGIAIAIKPSALRLAIGLGLATFIVFLTYHFGPIKLL
jgi:xanthine/uracil/vitamin C permease (AzgA family)